MRTFMGAALFSIGILVLLSFPVLILIGIWLPHGGYPRGQYIGTAFLDLLFGGIITGCGAALLDL